MLGDQYASEDRPWSYPPANQGARPNVVRLRTIVSRFVAEQHAIVTSGSHVSEYAWDRYQDAAVYHLFYEFNTDWYNLVVASPGISSGEVYRRFAGEFNRILHVGGRPTQHTPEHLFACLYQVARAFNAIHHSIVGQAPCMMRLRAAVWESIFTHDMRRYRQELFDKMADIATLILGESGTGKERVAQAIAKSQYLPYDAGAGRFGPAQNVFLTTALSALSPHLIESELFGHVRGAFTGAIQDRKGRLELCSPYGALFLDEIGDADAQIQVKLLRVLQYRTFERVGEAVTRRFAGKIIAATNRNLPTLMRDGKFRQDFYFRLCSDVITTPSLRQQFTEVPEDVINLVDFITAGFVRDIQRRGLLTADVLEWIDRHRDYDWPGNFRELEQCVKNILVRRDYDPPQPPTSGSAEDALLRIRLGRMTERELLSFYTSLMYVQSGSYEAAATRLGVNWRTVKSRVNRDAKGRGNK